MVQPTIIIEALTPQTTNEKKAQNVYSVAGGKLGESRVVLDQFPYFAVCDRHEVDGIDKVVDDAAKQLASATRQRRYVLLKQALLLRFIKQLGQSPAMILMQHPTSVMPRHVRISYLQPP